MNELGGIAFSFFRSIYSLGLNFRIFFFLRSTDSHGASTLPFLHSLYLFAVPTFRFFRSVITSNSFCPLGYFEAVVKIVDSFREFVPRVCATFCMLVLSNLALLHVSVVSDLSWLFDFDVFCYFVLGNVSSLEILSLVDFRFNTL